MIDLAKGHFRTPGVEQAWEAGPCGGFPFGFGGEAGAAPLAVGGGVFSVDVDDGVVGKIRIVEVLFPGGGVGAVGRVKCSGFDACGVTGVGDFVLIDVILVQNYLVEGGFIEEPVELAIVSVEAADLQGLGGVRAYGVGAGGMRYNGGH